MKRASGVLRVLGVLVIGNLGLTAGAALHWESTTVERAMPIGADAVEVSFPFSNPENHPVTIAHLQTSCGCTTTSLKKYTYAPGEKGVITAIFDGKGMSGVQAKTIQVDLDDQPMPTTLTLRVTIPEWIQASPRVLWWSVGDPGKAKEAVLTVNAEAKAKITSVKADNPAVTASVEPAEGPGRYRLIVTPASTATAFQATITIALELPGAISRTYTTFALVR